METLNPIVNSSRYFEVPDEYVGKSLNQINDILTQQNNPIRLGNAEVLASQYGLNANQPLERGFTFDLFGKDSGSAETVGLRHTFKPGMSPEQRAVQPAISTLQEGQEPLKQRYQKLLDSIKGREQLATREAEISTAREYGKRGIPLSSGAYDQALGIARAPIRQQAGEAELGATGEMEDRLQGIRSAISMLQGGAGKDAIANALSLLNFGEGRRQFDASLGLKNRELDLAKQQTNTIGLEQLWSQFG